MCGIKPCTKCSQKIGKMPRRKSPINSKALTQVGAGVAGVILARVLTSKFAFLANNPTVAGGVKLVGGLVLSGMGSPILAGAGMGISLEGGTQLVSSALPSLGISRLNGVGTIDLSNVHNISGNGSMRSNGKASEASMYQ